MRIFTVNGEISKDLLGRTYIHEHLTIDLSHKKNDEDARFDNTDEIVEELRNLKDKGISSLVEVTNIGMGRNPQLIKEMATRSGLNVIASTGFYKEPFLPDFVYTQSEKELSKLLVNDITVGMDDTGIKAHVIGEIGTSHNKVTEMEEKIFRAGAYAHLETGHPFSTHTTLGTMALWQVDFLRKEKVNLEKLIIGHVDLSNDLEYHLKIAQTGANLAFDTIGKNSYMPDEERIKCLHNLIDHGHLNQIVLSVDLTRKSHLASKGGIGYAYLLDNFIPKLLQSGITTQQIEQMQIHNPARILSVR